MDGMIIGKQPQSGEPTRMQERHQPQMRLTVFDTACREEPFFILFCPPQFHQALRRDISKQDSAPTEIRHRSATTK